MLIDMMVKAMMTSEVQTRPITCRLIMRTLMSFFGSFYGTGDVPKAEKRGSQSNR